MNSSFCPVPLELKQQQMKMRISHLLPLAILVSLGQGAQIWLLPCKSRFWDIVAQITLEKQVSRHSCSKGRVADSLPSVSSDHFRLQNPLNRSWCPLCSSWTSLEWKNRASFDSYFRASQNGIECTETDMHLFGWTTTNASRSWKKTNVGEMMNNKSASNPFSGEVHNPKSRRRIILISWMGWV